MKALFQTGYSGRDPVRQNLVGVLVALAISAVCNSASAQASAQASGLLFRASFDGPEGGEFVLADVASGERSPKFAEDVRRVADGRFGSAAYVPAGAWLAYETLGNLRARRGTLALWVQPDVPLFSKPYRGGRHPWMLYVSDLQNPGGANAFLRFSVNGPRSRFEMAGLGDWGPRQEWQPGE